MKKETTMKLLNSYENAKRAEAYARLEFPGTYYFAYRDLPVIIFEHVKGGKAVDFGCGTGRSTRFLHKLGFDVIGVDIAENMIKKTRELDPKGKYLLLEEGDFTRLKNNSYDLVLSAFTFDNIPSMGEKIKLFKKIVKLLNNKGKLINLVSPPEIYTHEWLSFSTKNFPENKCAKSGDKVKIIITDLEDKKPVEDIIWTDEYYQETFKRAGLEIVKTYKPLAQKHEPYKWINETSMVPWVIYILKRN